MVTVQPGLCIYCTDRMKTQSLRASGPSRSDFQWPDAVTVQLAELLQKMSETHQMERPSDEFFVFLREIAAVQPDASIVFTRILYQFVTRLTLRESVMVE